LLCVVIPVFLLGLVVKPLSMNLLILLVILSLGVLSVYKECELKKAVFFGFLFKITSPYAGLCITDSVLLLYFSGLTC
jgi:hypothetical protein